MSGVNPFRGGKAGKQKSAVCLLLTTSIMILLASGLIGCGSSDNGGQKKAAVDPPVLETFPQRLDKLAIKLHRQVATEDGVKNIFLSPLSLELALAMTMNGSGGETRSSIENALELSGLSAEEINNLNKELMNWLDETDPEITLDIANSLWARQDVPFSDDFLNLNKNYYDAEIESLDLQSDSAVKTINNWVKDNTNGKITEIIKPPISPQTILLLLNAIYFKGSWSERFEESETEDMEFTKGDGSKEETPMMHNMGNFEYLENDLFQAVRLPYGGGNMAMYVFLPKDVDGLQEFIESLNAEEWSSWLSGFAEMEGDLRLPRFKIEYEKTLNDALAALGMGVAFTDQADFSKMIVPGKMTDPVRIKTVKQKTYVDVNEEGTEAAAVTSVEMELTAVPEPGEKFEMTVDHPFYFVIRDDPSGTILFTGSIVDPGQKD